MDSGILVAISVRVFNKVVYQRKLLLILQAYQNFTIIKRDGSETVSHQVKGGTNERRISPLHFAGAFCEAGEPLHQAADGRGEEVFRTRCHAARTRVTMKWFFFSFFY